MDHRCEFTEEMFRAMYRRRGYQVYRLCREAAADRAQAMEMTFQTFTDAHRQLSFAAGELTVEYQDDVLLECTRGVLRRSAPSSLPAEEAPAAEEAPSPMAVPVPIPAVEEALPAEEELPAEETAPAEEETPCEQEEPALLELNAPIEPTDEPLLDLPEETVLPQQTPEAEEAAATPAEETPAQENKGIGVGWFLLVLFLLVLIFTLLWAIWGIAQNIFALPYYDLGYQWFNQNVYPLF